MNTLKFKLKIPQRLMDYFPVEKSIEEHKCKEGGQEPKPKEVREKSVGTNGSRVSFSSFESQAFLEISIKSCSPF